MLTFGLLARLAAELIALPVRLLVDNQTRSTFASLQIKGFATIAIALLIAAVWRWWGSGFVSRTMDRLSIYRDDHEASVWRSISNAKSEWHHLQVHLASGKIAESHFSQVSPSIPTRPLLINEDGIGIYITRIHRPDGSEDGEDDFSDEVYSKITYIPRSQIIQIDVGWKKID